MIKSQSYSGNTIYIIAIALIAAFSFCKSWEKDTVYHSDSGFYYSYLPTAFIFKDFSLKFVDSGKIPPGLIIPDKTPDGKLFFKMSTGLAILYSPFFFMGHITAKLFHYPANGYSYPYEVFVLLSCIFYVLTGLFYLRKLLLLRFNDKIVAITLICIVIGTNLLHYTTREGAMSHGFSFSLISIFLYMVYKWHQRPRFKNSLIIGLLLGLISLIRPTNALIAIIFLLYGVDSFSSLKKKIIMLIRLYPYLITIAVVVSAVWIPQLIYWKYLSGNWWFYSYQKEKFFWTKPHIIEGLVGYRKGWLLYTPIMSFAVAGLFFFRKKFPEFFISFILFFALSAYVLLCWWCWWFGGSFGQRSFIDFYGLWAIPFASFISAMFVRSKLLKRSLSITLCLLVALNLFKTQQYANGAINYDSMTKAAYWNSFLKFYPTDSFRKLLKRPDYENAKDIGVEKE